MFTVNKSFGALCRSSLSLFLKKANPTAHIVRMAPFCAMLIFLVTSAHAGTIFVAPMSGANEVPSNDSTNTGTATFELNDAETELSYDIVVSSFDLLGLGLAGANDISGLHLHNAAPGVNGPVVFGIFGPNMDADDRTVTININGTVSFSGVWDSTDPSSQTLISQIGNLKNNLLYINLHTDPDFLAGEIRGNLVLIPEPSTACLFGLALLGVGILRRRR